MKLNNKTILILGRVCSGKGTLAESMAVHHDTTPICTSNVVREISGASNRSGLLNTKNLQQSISAELLLRIAEKHSVGEVAIVEGIRQWETVKDIFNHFGPESVTVIWLNVPDSVRRGRYYARNRGGDDITFETVDSREEEMGIGIIEKNIKYGCYVINNYKQEECELYRPQR